MAIWIFAKGAAYESSPFLLLGKKDMQTALGGGKGVDISSFPFLFFSFLFFSFLFFSFLFSLKIGLGLLE